MLLPTLKSNKFALRPFRKGDEDSLRKNVNNRMIYRYTLQIPYPYTAKDAKDWVRKKISERRRRKVGELNFAIDINGEVVGGIGLMHLEKHKAEIGYWLGERYWGRGIMAAAVKLVCQYAFGKLKLRRVYASVFKPNKASARVLEKAGFMFEGVNRRNYLKDGRLLDGLLYARTR